MKENVTRPGIEVTRYAHPIGRGGTDAMNVEDAARNLGYVRRSKLGTPGGFAKLGSDLKLPGTILPPVAGVGVGVSIGPSSAGIAGTTNTYKINNYDSFTTYVVTATVGTVSVSGDTITYTIPLGATSAGFTVNGEVFTVTLAGGSAVDTPVILTPVNGATNVALSYTVTSSAFAVTGTTDTHLTTSWQLSTDSTFATVLRESIDSTTDMLSWTIAALDNATTYYVRVRYKGTTMGYSGWSEATVFTTKSMVSANWLVSADLAAVSSELGHDVSVDSSGMTVLVGAAPDGNGSAYVFIRTDTGWVQQAKLVAADGTAGAYFGWSVRLSADGNTAVIGAYNKNSTSGGVYVFVRVGAAWTQQAFLLPNNNSINWASGYSVAVSGDGNVVVVGGYYAMTYQGRVAVFTRSGTSWGQGIDISPSDGLIDHDGYGISVAISVDGGTIAVGANGKDSSRGAVYLFAYNSSSWTQQAKVTASDATPSAGFGYCTCLDLTGSQLVVGCLSAQKAYLFSKNGTTWSQITILTPDSSDTLTNFAKAVSIDDAGTVVLVSNRSSGTVAGSVYEFYKSGQTWTMRSKQAALVVGDAYGQSVDIAGSKRTFVVGAPTSTVGGVTKGAFYVYDVVTATSPQTVQFDKLAPLDTGNANDYYGQNVIMSDDGNTIIVSSVRGNAEAGEVYVFVRSGTGWVQEARLEASDKAPGTSFGYSVALSGDGNTVVIGAHAHAGGGAVYIFTRSGTTWTQVAMLQASGDSIFGGAVGISNDGLTIVTLSALDPVSGDPSKICRVYTKVSGVWTFLTFVHPNLSLSGWGASTPDTWKIVFSKDNNTFLVSTGSLGSGLVHKAAVFVKQAGTWITDGHITIIGYGGYGLAISGDGGTIVFGSAWSTAVATVHIYARTGTGSPSTTANGAWELQTTITNQDVGATRFGYKVAISADGNTLLVSADSVVFEGRGGAYLYTRSSLGWALQKRFTATEAGSGAFFGNAVSMNAAGTVAAISTLNDTAAGFSASGNVYVFDTLVSSVPDTEEGFLTTSGQYMGQFVGVSGSGDTVTSSVNVQATGTKIFSRPTAGTYTVRTPATVTVANFQMWATHAVSRDGATLVTHAVDQATGANSVFVYRKTGDTWAFQAQLLDPFNDPSTEFGTALACSSDGNTVVIGAKSTNNAQPVDAQGGCCVFRYSAGSWGAATLLTLPVGTKCTLLGGAVAVTSDGNTLAVSSEDGVYTGYTKVGSVWVFKFLTGLWTYEAKLAGGGITADSGFGMLGGGLAISADGKILFVGAYSHDTKGAVFVFEKSTTWTQVAKLTDPIGLSGNQFGRAVCCTDDGVVVAVGAPAKFGGMGCVFLYKRSSVNWENVQLILPNNGIQNQAFGSAVAISKHGEVLVVGSPYRAPAGGSPQGGTYIYS